MNASKGKDPAIELELSEDISKYQNIIILTDMIHKEHIIRCCHKIKEYGDKKIYILTTFGIFSDGLDDYDKAYKDNFFDKIICTNLCHSDDELRMKEWYQEVDMSNTISNIIFNLHNDIPQNMIQ